MAEHRRRPPVTPPGLTLLVTVSRAFSLVLLLLQLFLLLLLSSGTGAAAAAATGPCEIAFRLDDVQEYWITEAQEAVISRFVSNRVPLTIGVIASTLNQGDQQLASFLRNAVANNTVPQATPSSTTPRATSTTNAATRATTRVVASTTRPVATTRASSPPPSTTTTSAVPRVTSSSTSSSTASARASVGGPLVEVACHGWHHVDFSQLSLQQQVTELTNCRSILASYFPGSPPVTTFIAPYNTYNQNTISAMTSTGYRAISANDDCSRLNNSGAAIRHFPTAASTSYTGGEVGIGDGAPANFTIAQILAQLSQCPRRTTSTTSASPSNSSSSFSVVMLHPQEFARDTNGGLNSSALSQLDILLQWALQASGCSLRLLRDLSGPTSTSTATPTATVTPAPSSTTRAPTRSSTPIPAK